MSVSFQSFPDSSRVQITYKCLYAKNIATIQFNIYKDSHCEEDDYHSLWKQVVKSLAENRRIGSTCISYNRNNGGYDLQFKWETKTLHVYSNSFGYEMNVSLPIETKKWAEIAFELLSFYENNQKLHLNC